MTAKKTGDTPVPTLTRLAREFKFKAEPAPYTLKHNPAKTIYFISPLNMDMEAYAEFQKKIEDNPKGLSLEEFGFFLCNPEDMELLKAEKFTVMEFMLFSYYMSDYYRNQLEGLTGAMEGKAAAGE